MSKLVMMRGLPASGKTTKAKEIMESAGNYYRLNRDSLRKMLHFDKWSGHNEGVTMDVQYTSAKALLAKGENVIIDDTNLGEKHLNRWQSLAASTDSKFEVVKCNPPVNVCLYRDRRRKDRVGDHVIMNMAMQYGYYKPEKGYVIVDLDGTLANIEHRLHFVKDKEKKDWEGFFNHIPHDKLREDVAQQVMDFHHEGYSIVLMSGRPEWTRHMTMAWIHNFAPGMPFINLIMRQDWDKRPDTDTKKDMLKYYPDRSLIHKIIDDRPSVIRMWKEEGLDVIDVGKGVEF